MTAVAALKVTFIHDNWSSINVNGAVVDKSVCKLLVSAFQDASKSGPGNAKDFGAFFLSFSEDVSLAEGFQFIQLQFDETMFACEKSQGFEGDS